MNEKISVSTLVTYIKKYIGSDDKLNNLLVSGEISNYHRDKSNHLYFTLKDKNASLKCVMFRSYSSSLTFEPKDGDKVLINGYISIFEEAGMMQLYATKIQLDGLGVLYQQYEELKKKLDKEGYFNDDHKKDIPTLFPNKIAILVGKDSAAMSDIKKAFNLRWPICKVDYYPVTVQGTNAYKEIIDKLNEIDKFEYEIIVLARGGGSFEDYAPFNNEELVKCIYNLKTFIITGVGHERDYTLVDFVADKRGATPTAAIEHITPNKNDILNIINNIEYNLNNNINDLIESYRDNLDRLKSSKYFTNPLLILEKKELLFAYYFEKLQSFNSHIIETRNITDKYIIRMNIVLRNRINNIINDINMHLKDNKRNIKRLMNNKELSLKRYLTLLKAYSKENILSRGYSLVFKNDRIIKQIKDVNIDDELNIKLIDGEINTIVKGVNNGKA